MNTRLSSFVSWSKRFLSPTTVVCLCVVAYIAFTGDNTVFRGIDYDKQIDSLECVLAANRDTMLYYRSLNNRLSTDPALMEQVVREQYGMKRPSEDVFIFYDSDK